MKYKTRPTYIEAYQIPPNDEQTRALPPDWVVDRLMTGEIVAKADGGVSFQSTTGLKEVPVGDWLVKSDHAAHACSASVFANSYEPA